MQQLLWQQEQTNGSNLIRQQQQTTFKWMTVMILLHELANSIRHFLEQTKKLCVGECYNMKSDYCEKLVSVRR